MKVFILTREYRQTPAGLELCFWGTTGEQPVKLVVYGQQVVCFIRADQSLDHELSALILEKKSLKLATLSNDAVEGLYFSSQFKLWDFSKLAAQKGIQLFESDVKPTERYLMERFITGSCEIIGEPGKNNLGTLVYENPRLKHETFKPKIKWLSLDIETDITASDLYSIAVYGESQSHVFMVSNQALTQHGELDWSFYEDEKSLLLAFMQWIQRYDPDLLIGWNIVGFDLIVLERKCKQLGLNLNLGRENTTATIFKSRQAGEMNIAQLSGRVVMDGIEMLRAAFWSFESFALDFVAQELLGKNKLITQGDKPAEISRLFEQDKAQLARYNLEDCILVADIFKKTGLIEFAIERSSMTGLAFGRVGGSVAAFDNLYLPRLHRAGFVAPDVGSQTNHAASPGGYVIDSKPGLYDNVLVLDFKSLYPSIIRTFRIDPLGLAKPGNDPVPGFLEAQFSRSQSILPQLIEDLWKQRDLAKKDNNKPLSQAIKIIMNSFYGVLGTDGCRFFDPKLASSITRRGHEIIQNSQEFIEQSGKQVIYGDTDSIFVLLEPGLTLSQAKRCGEELMQALNEYWKNRIHQQFNLPSYLEVEFETHFRRFFMPTVRGSDQGSKKRYAGWVESENGDTELVIKGLEAVRGDWTMLARQAQSELLLRLFTSQPVEQYVLELAQGLLEGNFDDQLVYNKRLRKPLESYTKNVPPHVQAAKKMKDPGRKIAYMITLNGAEPVLNLSTTPDYDHYMERQLKPALQGILQCVELDFDDIVQSQMRLF